jgi:hypothetical protein
MMKLMQNGDQDHATPNDGAKGMTPRVLIFGYGHLAEA